MVFTRVEWDQPHVSIVNCVVFAVEELFKSTVVGTMARNRVHVSWLSVDTSFGPDSRFWVYLVFFYGN